ncbi:MULTISPECIES: hypothetical protein [Bacillaceae]|uniref:hypothetical protein n=1 Tax=Bacillaceae TaxID=186817 RepID=UPI001E2EB87B|nr:MULTISPECIES: hypothetical protein [Bacillaceae]MCE4048073.1 hypothetical protein [Bacillus sp. Au-Bac7]MCM3032651.1 hypothetical protein [Niallia sp. MER 6]MDL0434402.1 hypothetical protein [Niallia sp. SS-2023]UPO89146.1 hypothetical protein L8T27_008370 [Niallia sp. Man26]
MTVYRTTRLHGGAPVVAGVHVAPVAAHMPGALTGFVAPTSGFGAGNPTIIYPYKQFPAYMSPNPFYHYYPYYPPYYRH